MKNNKAKIKAKFNGSMIDLFNEVGINETSHHVLDLDNAKVRSLKDILDGMLIRLSYEPSFKECLESYNEYINGHKYTIVTRMNILNWVLVGGEKPRALLSKKERKKCKTTRNFIGLKKWGDITDRKTRVVFDEEFIRFKNGRKRKVYDKFDKMPNDKKIQWARYASLSIGEELKNPINRGVLVDESMIEVLDFAMKYACKMMDIPIFQGRFRRFYWIFERINIYQFLKTEKESNTLIGMTLGRNKPSKIIKSHEIIDTLIPTLHVGKLYKEYEKWEKSHKFAGSTREEGDRSKIKKIKKLIETI